MAATAYVTIISLPNANQAFRELTLGVVKTQVENEVKPRVFFTQFPNTVLYVRNVLAGGRWQDVFFADSRTPNQTLVHFAREGRIVVDRNAKFVQLQLLHGTYHLMRTSDPDGYDVNELVAKPLNKYIELCLLSDDGDRIRLTREGLFVSDALWPEML